LYSYKFYSFTETVIALNNKHRIYLQYQGYLETASIFTTENNPFSQQLFSLNLIKAPAELASTIAIKENLMLGKRVEAFFKIQIEEENSYKIILKNIQIQKEKITLGELDFILKEKSTSALKHVEVSYKFYLFDPNIEGNEIDKWIGPNRNDNLLKKITKLSEHQFPMLYRNEATKQLSLNNKEITQEVLFKAQLYIPFKNTTKRFKAINIDAIRGYYISFKDFLQLQMEKELFFIPQKQDWLMRANDNKAWHNLDTIRDELCRSIQIKKSLLIWSKDKHKNTKNLFITWW